MPKKNTITIDLDIYCTQATYAKESGNKLATVSQWVKRAKDNTANKIEILEIPQLNNLILVKRK